MNDYYREKVPNCDKEIYDKMMNKKSMEHKLSNAVDRMIDDFYNEMETR